MNTRLASDTPSARAGSESPRARARTTAEKSRTSLLGGTPIGLLLALTYAADVTSIAFVDEQPVARIT